MIIKNAQIPTGNGNETRVVDIQIEDGKIVSVEPDLCSFDHDVVDAQNHLVFPGAIDPHVHFDTPGFESREDFLHGTRAAAAGGVTTIIDMPCTSLPPVTMPNNLEKKLHAIKNMAYVDYALWGGVSSNLIRESDWQLAMQELWDEGVVGFKTYLISGMNTFKDLLTMELGQVLQYAAWLEAPVGLHAEDKDLVLNRTKELKDQNKDTLEDYYVSRSDPAEEKGVATGLGILRQTGAKLHIVHVASGKALRLIEQTKAQGLDVTAETCPQYLQFTHGDFETKGSFIKCAPVIKTNEDKEKLWEGIANGSIDFLATDHAPCSLEEKNTGNAWTDYGGMPGVQTMLPYLFSEGYAKKRIDLNRLVELTSSNAAKRYDLYPQKGCLEVGSDADFVIIDPEKTGTVKVSDMESKAKWTPFEGMVFTGKILKTFVRGQLVYDADKGVVGESGYGTWVRRGRNEE